MRYELIESAGQWIVACDGLELARFPDQELALEEITERFRGFSPQQRASLAVRFEKPCESAN